MTDEEQIRPSVEIRRVFELLDNVNTSNDKSDTFKFGMEVGKLIALGWVLGEVPSSDVALHYDFDSWVRDADAQADSLRRNLGQLETFLDDENDDN